MTIVDTAALLRNTFEDLDPDSILRIADLADRLAWLRDDDANDLAGYLPGWQNGEADAYEPTPEDWKEYAAWSRILDGGCGLAELTPDEESLVCHSIPDREYREMLQDELADRYADARYAELYG